MRKQTFTLVLSMLVVFLVPVLLSTLVYYELQDNMKISIRGNFFPFLLFPGFQVRHAHFIWNDKVELVSGDLNVQYNPVFFLPSNLRVRIQGEKLKAKFLGGWAQQQGIQDLDLDYFYADLGLKRGGIREVYAIEARGPKFQFRVKKSETLTSERTRSKELAA